MFFFLILVKYKNQAFVFIFNTCRNQQLLLIWEQILQQLQKVQMRMISWKQCDQKLLMKSKDRYVLLYLSLKNPSVFKNSISNSLKRYKAVFDILLENIFFFTSLSVYKMIYKITTQPFILFYLGSRKQFRKSILLG